MRQLGRRIVGATGERQTAEFLLRCFRVEVERRHAAYISGKTMCSSSGGVHSPPLADPVPVLYRSENYVVINKHFDLKINSDDPADIVTVATLLSDLHPSLMDKNIAHGFRFVHRLDYATSGCLCIALTKKAARLAGGAFANGAVTKHYLALVRGHLEERCNNQMTVEIPIGDERKINETSREVAHGLPPNRMCTGDKPNCANPRTAKTTVVLLEHGFYDNQMASKVLLIPQTGRRHQLRVHCTAIGHCIVGDYTYSDRMDSSPYRMMLHSYRLTVPAGTELVDVTAAPDPFTPNVDPLWRISRTIASYENYFELNTGV